MIMELSLGIQHQSLLLEVLHIYLVVPELDDPLPLILSMTLRPNALASLLKPELPPADVEAPTMRYTKNPTINKIRRNGLLTSTTSLR